MMTVVAPIHPSASLGAKNIMTLLQSEFNSKQYYLFLSCTLLTRILRSNIHLENFNFVFNCFSSALDVVLSSGSTKFNTLLFGACWLWFLCLIFFGAISLYLYKFTYFHLMSFYLSNCRCYYRRVDSFSLNCISCASVLW